MNHDFMTTLRVPEFLDTRKISNAIIADIGRYCSQHLRTSVFSLSLRLLSAYELHNISQPNSYSILING